MNEMYISLIPMIFVIGIFTDSFSFIDMLIEFSGSFLIILFVFNTFLFLLGMLFKVFQRLTVTLEDDYMVIENKGTSSTVYYREIECMSLDMGTLSRTHSTPMVLELYGAKTERGREVLLTLTSPPIIMIHLIRKKCPNVQMSYFNSKRIFWMMGISTAVAILIVVCASLGIPM
jgi:hypothetical protein